MRDYEILYIVRPDLDEEQLNQAVQRVTTLIDNLGGSHQKTDVWGKRRLAYEVDRIREGYYVLTDFQIEPERVPEMETTLKISDTVFRHLIVRKPEKAASSAVPAEAPAAVPTEAPAEPPAAVEAGADADAATAEESEAQEAEAAATPAESEVEPEAAAPSEEEG